MISTRQIDVLAADKKEARKFEDDIRADPDNNALVKAYFEFLRVLSRRSLGILYAMIPSIDNPVLFRANTSDILNIRQIFLNKEYGFEFPKVPTRILDLGAYCGYAAIYLANRFPDAEILCVEPSVQNFALLTANTLPYPNIRRINGAVWNRATHLKLSDRLGGHWGSIFGENANEINLEGGHDQMTKAFTVQELLRIAGWTAPDFVKCDIEGSEVEVFSDPLSASWIAHTAVLSVETHDRFRVGSTASVIAAMPPAQFDVRKSGEFMIFANRNIHYTATPDRRPLKLLASYGRKVKRFDISNVNQAPWGIQLINDDTLQIHPNPPGTAPAAATFSVVLDGQSGFQSGCRVDGHGRGSVVFGVEISQGGKRLVREQKVVPPGCTVELKCKVPRCAGDCKIILSTEMAPEAVTQGGSWARWVMPTLFYETALES